MSCIYDGVGNFRNPELQKMIIAPISPPEHAAAARFVRRHARDDADAALLLAVLGLTEQESDVAEEPV